MARKKPKPEPTAEDRAESRKQGELATKWLKAVKRRRGEEKSWREQGTAVVKRYRDERDMDSNVAKFAILWANTETIKPAIFSRMPVPDVRRRYLTKDPAARTAAMIMERALSFTMDSYDFRDTLDRALEDYVLPGRAQAVVTYKPYLTQQRKKAEPLPPDDPDTESEPKYAQGTQFDDQGAYTMEESKLYEEVRCRYQPWQFYVFGKAAQHDYVPWEAYGELLSRDELKEQYPNFEKFDKVPYSSEYTDEDTEKHGDVQKKCLVWRCWDKGSRTVIAVAEGYTDAPLAVEPDPLLLENFFPAPEPMYALRTNGSDIPKPEYLMYQDQAQELDLLCARQRALASALKYRGVYDKQLDELAKISDLVKAPDNTFIPVANFSSLAEKGGLEAFLDTLPIEEIQKCLEWISERIILLKAEIQEIYGISDIMRGDTDASETLGAQQLKAQYSGMRISTRQERFQRFIRDILRIMGEVIVEHFSPETLKIMTGIQVIPDVMYADLKSQQQIDPGMVSETEFKGALQLLKNDKLRGFRIDIETDSTVPVDKATEQQNRVEFMSAIGSFLQGIIPAVEQGAIPVKMAREALLFVVRGFKVGTELEETLELLGQDQDEAQQLAEIKRVQAQMQEEMAALKKENADLKNDAVNKQRQAELDMAIDKAKAANDMEIDRQKAANEERIKSIQAEHGEQVKGMQAQHQNELNEHKSRSEIAMKAEAAKQPQQISLQSEAPEANKRLDAIMKSEQQQNQILAKLLETSTATAQALQQILAHQQKPKNRKATAMLPSGPVEFSMTEQ